MKHKKSKILTLTLASLLGAAAFGGAIISTAADDDAIVASVPYSVTDVFVTSSATVETNSVVGFTVESGNKASITLSQRDLAWKWFTEKGKASYLNFKLSFDNLNFDTVTVVLETAAATANKDGKTTNSLVFKKENGKVYVSINDAEAKTEVNVALSNVISVRVNEENTEYGEYNVIVNDGEDKAVGKFVGVGAAYGEYASTTAATPLVPFRINVDVPKVEEGEEQKKTTIRVREINGQSFSLNEAGKILDNAKPVLVVNDEIESMTLGTAFALDYDFVDVLDKTVQKTVQYTQYNPEKELEYKDLTTSTYFASTPYKKDGKDTTVFAEYNGKEFVSIKVTLSDEFYKGDTKVEYDLSWYASTVETIAEKDYIILDRNEEGATYTFLAAEDGENKKSDNYEALYENYQAMVAKKAEGLEAGSNTDFYLPSLIGYIEDNGGYTNLKFTISYKSSNAASATTRSSLSHSDLKFPVAKSGTYQFKVYAVDKAGNSMMYYNEDGDLVEVTSSNVWAIEEIPYYTFDIKNTSLSVEDKKEANRKATVAVGKTYEKFSPNVLGDNASSATKEAKLYRIDVEALKKINNVQYSQSALSAITYEEVLAAVTNEQYVNATDYVNLYVDAYLTLLANKLKVGKDDVAKAFIEVQPYNDKITEEDHADEYAKNNVYQWNEDAMSFVAVNETDVYFTFAVYTDTQDASLKACAYQVVTVESEDDVLPGEDNWFKNNLVSIILFGVAGLMLILIIIVLLIKPSDETLEDVDAKANAKKEKNKNETEAVEATETEEASEDDKE